MGRERGLLACFEFDAIPFHQPNILTGNDVWQELLDIPPDAPIQPPRESLIIAFSKTDTEDRRTMLIGPEQSPTRLGRIIKVDIFVP